MFFFCTRTKKAPANVSIVFMLFVDALLPNKDKTVFMFMRFLKLQNVCICIAQIPKIKRKKTINFINKKHHPPKIVYKTYELK